MQNHPRCCLPAFIPNLFRASALGSESGGGGKAKNTERRAGGPEPRAARARGRGGRGGPAGRAGAAAPAEPAPRAHPRRAADLLQPAALCKTRPVMATTTSGFWHSGRNPPLRLCSTHFTRARGLRAGGIDCGSFKTNSDRHFF